MAISKKLLALMCALGLSLAGLAGCGSGSSDSGSNAGGNSGSNSGGSNGGSSSSGAGSDAWEELLNDPNALAYVEATPEGKEYLAVYSRYNLTKEMFTGKMVDETPRVYGLDYEEYADLDVRVYKFSVVAGTTECNIIDSDDPIEQAWYSVYTMHGGGTWSEKGIESLYSELVNDWRAIHCVVHRDNGDSETTQIYATLKDGSMIRLPDIDDWFVVSY